MKSNKDVSNVVLYLLMSCLHMLSYTKTTLTRLGWVIKVTNVCPQNNVSCSAKKMARIEFFGRLVISFHSVTAFKAY